ncbi:MAG TPA: redoxin domain-containing protein, partial [Planctomycetes bacterium]|nr:redoxin domain-containing protein [Planctomycetota bacterium]
MTRRLTAEEGLSWSGHERNHTFLGLGDGSFADATHVSGADIESDGRALAVLDWDGDGRLDLLLHSRGGPRLQLFHNRFPANTHWLSIELEGDGERVNRDAVGTRVELIAGKERWVSSVRAGEGFLAQSSRRIHFGLGEHEAVDSVVVHWPDGTRSVIEDVQGDRRYRIVYGEPRAQPVQPPKPSPGLQHLTARSPVRPEGKAPRIVLAEPLPLSSLELPSYDPGVRRLAAFAGTPVLLTIWSRTCPNCMKEFIARRRWKDRLDALDVRIIPLNIDRPVDPDASRRMLARYDQDASEAGPVDDAFSSLLVNVLFPNLLGHGAAREILTPTSLLIDRQGRLVALYLGSVPFERL